MRLLPRNLPLNAKFYFFAILFIFIIMILLKIYFDTFLEQKYREQAQRKLSFTLTHFYSNMQSIEKALRKGVVFIQDDPSFIASVELINDYQDLRTYPALLLDEEKKKIAQQLLYRVKLSLNSEMSAYDCHGKLIAYVTKTPHGYELSIISYNHGKPIRLRRYEHQTTYVPQPLTRSMREPIVSAPISYHAYGTTLILQAHQRFVDPKTYQTLLSITLERSIDASYFNSLVDVQDVHLFGSRNPNYSPVWLAHHPDDHYYLRSVVLSTTTSPFYVVASLEKHFLATALHQNRQQFLVLVIAIALTTLLFAHFILNRILGRPLETLMQQIHKIDHQDYSPSTVLVTHDELQTLSQELNRLAHTIQQREQTLQESQQQLEILSHTDTLTGLANRRLFYASLNQAITLNRQNNRNLAVIFIDLDNFKEVNDTLGHDTGDKLLQNVANRLTRVTLPNNLLARIGGDEFTLFIDDYPDTQAITHVANTLLQAFSTPFTLGEHTLFITASLGISLFPNDSKSLTTLVKYADLALYHAKNSGRNTFSFFSQEFSQNIQHHRTYLHALNMAMETKREFHLLYQPKVSPDTGNVVGAEALVRWESATLGTVYPDKFISFAEESGLIIPLGEWILQQACHDFVHLHQEGYPLKQISVNVSNIQLQKSDMFQTLKTVIQQTGILPQQLEIEITESYLATDQDKALFTLQSLRTKGISIAIDDFGTGYSSLSYLRKLPITRLKIDKSFVDDLPFSPESVAVVNAIIALAKTFNLSLTAEGVETQEQLDFLKAHHCDEIQGYYYAKPLPLEAFKAFYRNHNPLK